MKRNLKLVVGIVIGVIASCGIGYVVAENITASNIIYTNNNQATVAGALNDLYDKANAVPVECYIRSYHYLVNFYGTVLCGDDNNSCCRGYTNDAADCIE